MTNAHLVGPETVILYICKGCGVWTVHRRSRCAWCPCTYAPDMVQYINEGAVPAAEGSGA